MYFTDKTEKNNVFMFKESFHNSKIKHYFCAMI